MPPILLASPPPQIKTADLVTDCLPALRRREKVVEEGIESYPDGSWNRSGDTQLEELALIRLAIAEIEQRPFYDPGNQPEEKMKEGDLIEGLTIMAQNFANLEFDRHDPEPREVPATGLCPLCQLRWDRHAANETLGLSLACSGALLRLKLDAPTPS